MMTGVYALLPLPTYTIHHYYYRPPLCAPDQGM